jgi:hypothetical protein
MEIFAKDNTEIYSKLNRKSDLRETSFPLLVILQMNRINLKYGRGKEHRINKFRIFQTSLFSTPPSNGILISEKYVKYKEKKTKTIFSEVLLKKLLIYC